MSKAFVRESEDDDEAPELQPSPPPARNYISPAGYARLKGELKQLVEAERSPFLAAQDTVRTTSGRSTSTSCLSSAFRRA